MMPPPPCSWTRTTRTRCSPPSPTVPDVLIEGGPTLAGAFLAAELVDRIVAYVAPVVLGAGRAAVEDAGVGTIGGARRFSVEDVARVGADVRIVMTRTE